MFERALVATGLLYYDQPQGDPIFLGTSFLFRTPNHALTAAHCVGALNPDQLRLRLPYAAVDRRVINITRHSRADLAVLELEEVPNDPRIAPLYGPRAISPMAWGDAFGSLGFPEDTWEEKVLPTTRCLRGHIQRFYGHHSHMGYTYRAGEMSVGAPAGLSGGPVLLASDSMAAIGVVAENRQSTTFLHQLEEIQDAGHTYKESIHSVIQYGAFVVLASLEDWLDTCVPPHH